MRLETSSRSAEPIDLRPRRLRVEGALEALVRRSFSNDAITLSSSFSGRRGVESLRTNSSHAGHSPFTDVAPGLGRVHSVAGE